MESRAYGFQIFSQMEDPTSQNEWDQVPVNRAGRRSIKD